MDLLLEFLVVNLEELFLQLEHLLPLFLHFFFGTFNRLRAVSAHLELQFCLDGAFIGSFFNRRFLS